jgi:hypothetical protein
MDLRVNRSLLLFLFLVPGLAGIPAAIAQDNLGVAKAHYNKAARLYDVGEYRQALDEFKAAQSPTRLSCSTSPSATGSSAISSKLS